MKIYLQVKPNSRSNEVTPIDSTHYQVSVIAPASQNKANDAVVELMASYFHVAKSLVTIIRGQASKKKILEISTNLNLPL